ncbi:dual specificity protein kinase CLK2-like [Symsagittifera roscoffensis]|uniref:dual specificity protein kinase CLK2-like n=1 Tax=Symsagittifera roscoffensis TaxID=84072 RepID=UPI00307B33D4
MSGRSRNVPREFRKKVKSRSRSCDSSRSRHYDNCVEASSLKYQMRQQQYPKVSGSSRSYKYSSPKRSMKRPHYRQEDSISIQRKQRKISRTTSTCRQQSNNYAYEAEKEGKKGRRSNYPVLTTNTAKQRSCSSPRRTNSQYQQHQRRRKPRRHSESSYSNSRSSSDDGYRSLEVAKPPKCDEEGHLVYKKGDLIQGRYELLSTLGEGAFGRVIKCADHDRNGRRIALKVIKNVQKYREEAKLEIKVLETIIDKDRKFKSGCIYLLDWFNLHGFMCLAFDLLGKSIYDFLKDNNYYPFPMKHIRKIAQQLGSAVKFLHDHGMTHTDLKPENILFIDSSYEIMWNVDRHREERILRCCEIKLIDFGSTTFDDEHHTKIVQTRHYRAPEVILELGWSQSCDVWSIGCILFELYTGETMFLTHDNHEHLAMMTYILGRIPSSMIKKSKKTKYFYHGRLNWDFDERNSSNKYIKQHCKPLSRCLKHRNEEDELLLVLLWDCLAYDPENRLSMSQYLKHEYLRYDSPPNTVNGSSSSAHNGTSSKSKAVSNKSSGNTSARRERSSSKSRHRTAKRNQSLQTPDSSKDKHSEESISPNDRKESRRSETRSSTNHS